jgi:hypothetical protein
MKTLLGTLVLALALAACSDAAKARPEAPAPAHAAPVVADGPAYRVDVLPPASCRVAAPCELGVRVTALRDFHVNPEYPFKVVAEPNPDLVAEPPTPIALADARTGTLTYRFRAARAGTLQLRGAFRLSICNDAQCLIETAPVAVDLPVQ